ncbi:MAG: CRISPR-associated endonuclease Cas2 [Methylobacter sp.]|nr:MAG: CRISPR-associated endonuclease Cas2 [Methylobacter sp.]PPD32301.1 MAG: CRISPR-associated endonuclease Cas2 [Methylomonas sp.]
MIDSEQNNLNRRQRWMVAYDVSDNRRRRLIHKTLSDHGNRVQYSVFECELSRRQLNELRNCLQDYLEEGDSIRWYPLCVWCHSAIDFVGISGRPADTDYFLL